MTLHLAEISTAVAPGAHAILLPDQAGWHGSAALIVPANITLLPLPSKCPELNPVENIWQFMRDNWLSNRIFKSYAGNPRPMLLRLEPPCRSTLAHHVHRAAPLGTWVMVSETW